MTEEKNSKAQIPKGFILTARKFLQNDIMINKPPLFAKLWLWLLLNARYKDDPERGLRRGQLFTSIDSMRDAMSYRAGYRKIIPSRKAIRDAYSYFTKVGMTVTTRVTHGMIITIYNYGFYQDASNYEGHSEGHTNVTDIKKKGFKKEKEGKDIREFSRRSENPIYSFQEFCNACYVPPERTKAIEYYLDKYRQKRGEEHPRLRGEQWQDAVNFIFCALDEDVEDLESVLIMIDKHFNTAYREGCDYRIMHYISGSIQDNRFYEELY